MTEKISGFSKAGTDTRLARSRSAGETGETGRLRQAPASEASADQVELTSAATRLRNLEARLKNLDEVDSRRVAELRQRIEAGDYEIDPDRIAASLLDLERKLSG